MGYLAAISVAHQSAANPAAAPLATGVVGRDLAAESAGVVDYAMVRRVMAGIRRHPTVTPARRRSALRPEHLEAILEGMRPHERLADARDAALLLTGWKAALRTDDLARLDVTDVMVTTEGLVVHLRRSKTDQDGAAVVRGIAAAEDPDDPLDAVAAWRIWRERLASFAFHAGPAWRGIARYGTRPRPARLSTKTLDAIVARRAAAAELPGNWCGHSLRRGFATSALAAGASERAVREHGRWRSAAAIAAYIDEAERFADTNPTRVLSRRFGSEQSGTTAGRNSET